MNIKKTRIYASCWHYLNQPLFDRNNPAVLNPRRFWRLYRVGYLERCWIRSYSEKPFEKP